MKTIEINNVLNADLLLVEVPGVYEIIHHDNGVIAVLDSVVQWEIKGSYTLLGKLDKISEENAIELVKSFQFGTKENPHLRFLDYKTDYFHCFTATESLMSALETRVYWDVNPIPTPEIQGGYTPDGCFVGGYDDNWISEFEKAESRTFDRNRTLIFKKN